MTCREILYKNVPILTKKCRTNINYFYEFVLRNIAFNIGNITLNVL